MKTNHDLFRALIRHALKEGGWPAAELDAKTKQLAQEYFDRDPEAAADNQRLTDDEFAYRLQKATRNMPEFLLKTLGVTCAYKNVQN